MKEKSMAKKVKMSKGDVIYHVICYIVFSILVIVFAYPFYYLLICTISENKAVNLNQVTFYPIGVHFRNYISVLKLERLQSAAIVSVARTVVGTACNVIGTAYMAYFFTKENMWHRKFFYRLFVATMYFSAGLIPGYLNTKMLGLLNTFWVYVIPSFFGVYNMILVKTFMESIPESLEESAEIDGAGYLVRFTRIMLPLSKPILATVGLFTAVAQWNAVFDTKLYVTNTKLYSLQFVLYEYYNQVKALQTAMEQLGADADSLKVASELSVRLTMTAVTVIPIMCVYPFIQKYYMKGMMLGAVKG